MSDIYKLFSNSFMCPVSGPAEGWVNACQVLNVNKYRNCSLERDTGLNTMQILTFYLDLFIYVLPFFF